MKLQTQPPNQANHDDEPGVGGGLDIRGICFVGGGVNNSGLLSIFVVYCQCVWSTVNIRGLLSMCVVYCQYSWSISNFIPQTCGSKLEPKTRSSKPNPQTRPITMMNPLWGVVSIFVVYFVGGGVNIRVPLSTFVVCCQYSWFSVNIRGLLSIFVVYSQYSWSTVNILGLLQTTFPKSEP